MCTKQTIYKPMKGRRGGVSMVAAVNPSTNLQRVSRMTDTLVKLANRLELPLGTVLEMMQRAGVLPFFYQMQDDGNLTQRQMVNRIAKALGK